MGFFSKIKKLWKTKPETEEAVPTPGEGQPAETLPEEEQAAAQPLQVEDTREAGDWKQELQLFLQQASPRLSAWLDIILEDLEYADQRLWSRLEFLFESLEVPAAEASDFIARFRKWLRDMDYEHISEFRSELQYRLALALDLEDEEDEKSRLFIKLSNGLNKTKEQLSKRIDGLLLSSSGFDAGFWEELEEILILADVGFQTSTTLVERMQRRVREEKISDPESFKEAFQQELAQIFPKQPKKIKPAPPEVILTVGVNGVGKTTTIAKLAHRAQMQGQKVMLAAGDTFRAAGIEQLEIWAERAGAGFYTKDAGSDPAAVAYEALQAALKKNYDLLIIDTAGRLHTQTNLMQELKKIKRVLNKMSPGAPHRTMLVVDGTSGQNVVAQTRLFNEGVGVDEIVITKLDGTAKGGVILGIAMEQKIPITFVGLGEKMEDLRPFSGQDFARALLS
ncbi:MAG: signal recognition particle-docking protein FtsY [Thermodesulfobacteriota bacterium]